MTVITILLESIRYYGMQKNALSKNIKDFTESNQNNFVTQKCAM